MTRVLHLYLDESGTPGSPKSRGDDGLYHLGVGCVATVDAAAAAKAWHDYAAANLPTTDGGTWRDEDYLGLAPFLSSGLVLPIGSYARHSAADVEAAAVRIEWIVARTGRTTIAPSNLAWLQHMIFVVHRAIVSAALAWGRVEMTELVFHLKTMKPEHWEVFTDAMSIMRPFVQAWWRRPDRPLLDFDTAVTAAAMLEGVGDEDVLPPRRASVEEEPLLGLADAVAALARRGLGVGFPLARAATAVIAQALAPVELRSLLFVDDSDSSRAALNRGIERELIGREPPGQAPRRGRRR